jgi:phosphatidylglycerophosphate synthase
VPEQALIPYVHFIAAAVMFVILVVFCWFFYNRAHEKKDRGSVEAGRRMVVYQVCGVTIVIAMVAMAIDFLAGSRIPRMVWYGETASLIAFGISWLTAARVVPLLSRPEERPSALNKS